MQKKEYDYYIEDLLRVTSQEMNACQVNLEKSNTSVKKTQYYIPVRLMGMYNQSFVYSCIPWVNENIAHTMSHYELWIKGYLQYVDVSSTHSKYIYLF